MRNSLGEAEVSDFPNALFEEDVGWLDISVDDIVSGEVLASL